MKKIIFKVIGLILIYVVISVGIYFVLRAFGLTTVGKIRKFVSSTGKWSYVVFLAFQVVVSTFVCIVPFEDELLTSAAILLFGATRGFFVAAAGMFITSMLQFVIGRCFCKSLVEKLIGDECVQKYQNYLKVKGEIMLPMLYAIPLLPHDTLCIMAGMSKMKWWYFAPVTLIMRSIEIASICFLGSGLIDFAAFTIFDWLVAINMLVIDVFLILKLQKFVENKINKNN